MFFINPSPILRDILGKVYHNKCQYCGKLCEGQIEHIIPKSLGGQNCLENYVLSCSRCNISQKKNLLLLEPGIILLQTIAESKKIKIINLLKMRRKPKINFRRGEKSEEVRTFDEKNSIAFTSPVNKIAICFAEVLRRFDNKMIKKPWLTFNLDSYQSQALLLSLGLKDFEELKAPMKWLFGVIYSPQEEHHFKLFSSAFFDFITKEIKLCVHEEYERVLLLS